MRRERGQLPSQPIANPRNNSSNLRSNVPSKNPQFENAKAISDLRSGRILRDPYLDLVGEVSADASQKLNLEEETHTEIKLVKEPELEISIDAGSNLNENGKGKKRADKLSDTYKPGVPFPSALEAGFSRKK